MRAAAVAVSLAGAKHTIQVPLAKDDEMIYTLAPNGVEGAPRIHGELLKLASMSARLRLPSTWPETGAHRRRAGERSS
jgi:hypothetical protein